MPARSLGVGPGHSRKRRIGGSDFGTPVLVSGTDVTTLDTVTSTFSCCCV